MTFISTLAINLMSNDLEHSGPLRDAMEAEGLPIADGNSQQAVVAIAVVDTDPWERGRELLTDNVRGVLVLCTGPVDRPPADAGDDIVVRHWSDPDTAVIQVAQFFKKKQRGADRGESEPPAEAGVMSAPPPGSGTPPPPDAAPPPGS
ncbi:MAG: hypothetical protein V3T05_04065, partial [Myxococcota bacterium]